MLNTTSRNPLTQTLPPAPCTPQEWRGKCVCAGSGQSRRSYLDSDWTWASIGVSEWGGRPLIGSSEGDESTSRWGSRTWHEGKTETILTPKYNVMLVQPPGRNKHTTSHSWHPTPATQHLLYHQQHQKKLSQKCIVKNWADSEGFFFGVTWWEWLCGISRAWKECVVFDSWRGTRAPQGTLWQGGLRRVCGHLRVSPASPHTSGQRHKYKHTHTRTHTHVRSHVCIKTDIHEGRDNYLSLRLVSHRLWQGWSKSVDAESKII